MSIWIERDKLLNIPVIVKVISQNNVMLSTVHGENINCESIWKYIMHMHKGMGL